MRACLTRPALWAHGSRRTHHSPSPHPSPARATPLAPTQSLFAEIEAAELALKDAKAALATLENPVADVKSSGSSSPGSSIVSMLVSKLGETKFHCSAALDMIETMKES